MNSIFHNKLEELLIIYIDDILIYSKSVKEPVGHLEYVMQKQKENGLCANKAKSEFAQMEMDFLGHVLSLEEIRLDLKKVSTIKEWLNLVTTKGVWSFLDMENFYRRFIVGFLALAKPLTDLLKELSFEWPEEQENAFEVLKKIFFTSPILKFPNFTKPFEVHIDANGFLIGGVLM